MFVLQLRSALHSPLGSATFGKNIHTLSLPTLILSSFSYKLALYEISYFESLGLTIMHKLQNGNSVENQTAVVIQSGFCRTFFAISFQRIFQFENRLRIFQIHLTSNMSILTHSATLDFEQTTTAIQDTFPIIFRSQSSIIFSSSLLKEVLLCK